jgi:molecular chaperone HtpG
MSSSTPLSHITLPHPLASQLANSPDLLAAVTQALVDFAPVLRQGHLIFFPDYTDHGELHVQEVLNTATSLIRPEALPLMTSADAAVLIVATLLHDLALALTPDAFLTLLAEALPASPSLRRNTYTWAGRWDSFCGDASRFSARKNIEIWGNPEPVPPPRLSSPASWTQSQLLFIGEFIRRNHGDIALHIALHGLPSPSPVLRLHLSSSLGDLSHLAGIVAMSHTIPLRRAVDHLETAFAHNRRDPRGCHAPFLMSLLRIADFMQIQASRAPHQLMSIRSLRASISRREWHLHRSVKEISTSQDDREAVFVDAHPPDVASFLRLKALLTDLQLELDHSWAILGEVYGPVPTLHPLGLTLRRVRSNCDDVDTFSRSALYYPEKASFTSADVELLRLLLAPLYGDSPGIGVRELVQNAVDAVRERDYLLAREPALSSVVRPLQTGDDVIVAIEHIDSGPWLRVTDNGRGMTAEVLINYFLRAGASFRMSDAWRRDFEDVSHSSQVLRSGRFGIGALAGFLLGDEIEVATRDIRSAGGIIFRARLDTEPIELRKADSLPVGTTIRIKLDPERVIELTRGKYHNEANAIREWDWFFLEKPQVARYIDERRLGSRTRMVLPQPGAQLSEGWFRVDHPDFEDVHWRYENPTYPFATPPLLYCNGIRIGDGVGWYWKDDVSLDGMLPRTGGGMFEQPTVSVFDRNGMLPLRLDRSGLIDSTLPFEQALLDDIVRDCIAFGLVCGPRGPIVEKTAFEWYLNRGNHPSLRGSRGRMEEGTKWFCTERGYALWDKSIVAALGKRSLLIVGGSMPAVLADILRSPTTFVVLRSSLSASRTPTVEWLKDLARSSFEGCPFTEGKFQAVLGKRWASTENVLSRSPRYVKQSLRREKLWDDSTLLSPVTKVSFSYDLRTLVRAGLDPKSNAGIRIAEWVPTRESKASPHLTRIAQKWLEYLPEVVIPYDQSQRGSIRRRLSKVLGEHLTHWEAHLTKLGRSKP